MTDDFEPMPSSDAPAQAGHGSSRRTTLAVVAVIVLATLVAGGVLANAVWGRHAMMVTGLTAAQALIEGRAQELAAVSNAEVRAGLTTATADTMRAGGLLGEFSSPEWSGDEATVTVTTGTGVGTLLLAPADDGANVVVFRTVGDIGMATGAIAMQRTWTGWAVSGLTVAPIEKPAAHPSAAPTDTPAP